MREIKFRAWSNQDKKMYSVTDDLCLIDGKVGWLQDGWDLVDEFDDPIMHFTGLKDKNYKEIYESDILKLHIPSGEFIHKVEWNENGGWFAGWNFNELFCCGTFMVDGHSQVDDETWCEVIGNIYQNPELLK